MCNGIKIYRLQAVTFVDGFFLIFYVMLYLSLEIDLFHTEVCYWKYFIWIQQFYNQLLYIDICAQSDEMTRVEYKFVIV